MKIMKQVALVISLFFLLVSAAADVFAGNKPISIRTSTPLLSAPISKSANILLVVETEKHEGNRQVTVICESTDNDVYYSSSSRQLEGSEDEPIRHDFGFSLPSATYCCEAILDRVVDGTTKEYMDSLTVVVL